MKFNKKKFWLVCLLIINHPFINALSPSKTQPNGFIYAGTLETTGYTITEPGYYIVAEDIEFVGGNNTTALTTATDHVTIDMNNHAIYKTGAGTSVTGIEINPNSHNITIKNGTVAGFNQYGLVCDASASGVGSFNIDIEDFHVTNAVCTSAIRILGNAGSGQKAHDITFSSCTITEISATSNAIYVNYCNNIIFSNCSFNHIASLDLMEFNNSKNCTILQCSFENNEFTGTRNIINLNLSLSDFLIDGCIISGNYGNGILRCLLLNECPGSIVKNCLITSNSSEGHINGIILTSTTNSGCILEACTVTNLTSYGGSSSSYGIRIDQSDNHIIKNCLVQNLRSSLSTDGFYFSNADNCLIKDCSVIACTSSNAVGNGIRILSDVDNSILIRCKSYNNSHYGLQNQSTTAIIVGCEAGNNGATNYITGGTTPNFVSIDKLGANTAVEEFANTSIT